MKSSIEEVSKYVVKSLSARRAWIEMPFWGRKNRRELVALRKESVDRNEPAVWTQTLGGSRSPQGERG